MLEIFNLKFVLILSSIIGVAAAASAETFNLREVPIGECEAAISAGKNISNNAIRNLDTSYWLHDGQIYQLTVTAPNTFSVRAECRAMDPE